MERLLVQRRVREIILIAEDTTQYGSDWGDPRDRRPAATATNRQQRACCFIGSGYGKRSQTSLMCNLLHFFATGV